MEQKTVRLNVLAIAFALGITWCLSVFLLGLAAYWFDWGTEAITWIGSLYIGFEPTIVGSLIGAIWGFIDAFIGGLIFAWLYNLFSSYFCKHCA